MAIPAGCTRTQKMGVRMALGAQRRDVLRLIVGEGAPLAVLGVGIGIAASLDAGRSVSRSVRPE